MQEQLPRRKNGRIVSYATIFTTQQTDKKTSQVGIFFAENRLRLGCGSIVVSTGNKGCQWASYFYKGR